MIGLVLNVLRVLSQRAAGRHTSRAKMSLTIDIFRCHLRRYLSLKRFTTIMAPTTLWRELGRN